MSAKHFWKMTSGKIMEGVFGGFIFLLCSVLSRVTLAFVSRLGLVDKEMRRSQARSAGGNGAGIEEIWRR
jgi:hypothetical protein